MVIKELSGGTEKIWSQQTTITELRKLYLYIFLYNNNKYRKKGHGFVREEGMGEVGKRTRENVNTVHIVETEETNIKRKKMS